MSMKMKKMIDKSDYDILCLLPCPIKVPIEIGFDEMVKELGEEWGFPYLVEGNANYDVIWLDESSKIPRKEELPQIIISSGVNSFYRRDFRKHAVKEKYFKKVQQSEDMKNSDFYDPKGNYSIIALNYQVMIVDLTRLHGRPIPRSFAELLDSEFYKEVAIRGKKNRYCETTLFSIYKDFGMEGIKKLSNLVGYSGHPAEMVKKIGSGLKDAPTISIVPEFYAKLLKHNKNAEIVWPKEGGIISPVTLLVRSDAPSDLNPVIQYFTSDLVREVCKQASIPHPQDYLNFLRKNDYRLNWVGWDFVENNDTNLLLIELNNCFL